jgi:hypothetical protein
VGRVGDGARGRSLPDGAQAGPHALTVAAVRPWVVVAAAFAGLPLLVAGEEASRLADGVARGPADLARSWASLEDADSLAPVAVVLLGLSLAYLSVHLLLCTEPDPNYQSSHPSRQPVETRSSGNSGRVPYALLAGGMAGAALLGAEGWTLGAGLAAAAVGAATPVAARKRGPILRAASAVLLGVVAATVAGPADTALRGLVGGRPFPEAWFVVAAAAGAGWLSAGVILVVAGSLAGGWGIGRLALGTVAGAPAWILLCGPAHPIRGAAAALAAAALARLGASPFFAAALAALLALAPAAAALR